MRLLITGAGRGGTNLATELLRLMNIAKFTDAIEDREFFKIELPENYATKLSTENVGFTSDAITGMMLKYDDLRIIFSHRHPFDICLSKIVRGQPGSKGGDKLTELTAPDGTVEGSIDAVLHMTDIYINLRQKFPDRIFVLKMEDLLENTTQQIEQLCNWLDIKYNPEFEDFYKHNRNGYQKNRYGIIKDVGQINLYKKFRTSFGGFFKDDDEILQEMILHLYTSTRQLGYNI